ncbi:hypothetical protein IG631_23733 [Alternaria alternata]|nr:hypothetical protein IG631_23733 [Alternaria alternata]
MPTTARFLSWQPCAELTDAQSAYGRCRVMSSRACSTAESQQPCCPASAAFAPRIMDSLIVPT